MAFGTTFATIYKQSEEIDARQNIPEASILLFEERLGIVCTISKAQPRRGRTANHEQLKQSREKRARRIYLDVLEKCPDIFLAFILAVSPRHCLEFDLLGFFQQHREQPIFLCNEANLLLWEIAVKKGFEKSDPFRKLMARLFSPKPPATAAEGKENCSLVLSDLTATRIAFGDTICDAVECSPTHRPKRAEGDYSNTTECVWANVPYFAPQDTIVHLDVGSALKLADVLFPIASQRIASVLSESGGSEAALGPEKRTSSLPSDIGMQGPNPMAIQGTNFAPL